MSESAGAVAAATRSGSSGRMGYFVPTTARAVGTMLRRDSAERRFVGLPFALDFAFGLVNLLVFVFVSRVLHPSTQPLAGRGGSYFDFVAVGLAFMLVVQAATTQITTRVQEEKRSGTLEMLTTQPVGAGAIAVGMSAYPMLFAVVRSAVYLGIAASVLGLDVGSADWFGVAVVMVLGGTAATCLGIVLAAVTVVTDQGIMFARLMIVALSFLSGTYFPVSALPPALRWLGVALPTRLTLDGLRASLSGSHWTHQALLLAVWTAVGLPSAVWVFSRALHLATRLGTLNRG